MSTQLIPVPFRGTTLFVVSHEAQPFTPMKPIVEGMGLAWQVQHRKLTENPKRFCITEMVIQIPGDFQRRNAVCMPLRKLPGWLMSIHPNKVKPEIKDSIIAYQNECDDVLWQYWNQDRPTTRQGNGPTIVSQPRLHRDLIYAYRTFDLAQDACAKQGLINVIKNMHVHLDIVAPDFALVGKPANQTQLEV
jgi:hypothetical protein